MKILFYLVVFTFLSFLSYGQKLKFKIENQKDTTIFLVKYIGKGLYYADTAEMKNGVVEYDGSKQEAGILAVLLPGNKYFEFIYDNKEVNIETEEEFEGIKKFYTSRKMIVAKFYSNSKPTALTQEIQKGKKYRVKIITQKFNNGKEDYDIAKS